MINNIGIQNSISHLLLYYVSYVHVGRIKMARPFKYRHQDGGFIEVHNMPPLQLVGWSTVSDTALWVAKDGTGRGLAELKTVW